ncbi:hypothetical protein CVT24_000981 [Panaeolus cyanescens]|uniref:Reverse transcriptase domain-containing protein n=1 Tax=Panaeolus cyanescens TaxID=181874 RepID=A0A409YCH5_9AGAR|nr:hypothetical protein CVT24_000981 [Panaeolus cyanescens]
MVQNQPQGEIRPRTHSSPAVIEALKSLSLRERLLRNKKIDANNERRASQQVDFLMGLVNVEPSDFESEITISVEEMNKLLLPGAMKDYAEVATQRVKDWVAEQLKTLQASGGSGKRPLTDSEEDPPVSKKLKLFSRAPLVDYNPTENPKLTFQHIWFVTEASGKIPLPWFRPSSIEKLNFNSMQPSWTSPCFVTTPDGTQKKFSVFDVEKILGMKGESALFPKETDIPFADWLIASRYRYDFEVARAEWDAKHNGEDPDYSHADDLGLHFDFFENQKDAQVTYDFWKEEEASIRRNKVHGFRTNKDQLRNVFAMAKFKYEESQKRKSEEDVLLTRIAGLEKLVQQGTSSRSGNGSNGFARGDSKQSFRSQNTSSQSSSPPACLYCGEAGHRVHDHPKDKTKFSDGKSVSPSISKGNPPASPFTAPRPKLTSAPSVEVPPTTPSLSPAEGADSLSSFLEVSLPPSLIYSDFSATIVRRPPGPSHHLHPLSLFEKIVTPYSADAFESDLHSLNIFHKYPLLCHNLRHGFPLGNMPQISKTHVFPNHFSTLGHEKAVDSYLEEEVGCGRLDGPFSREVMEEILRGPFISSPLLIVSQPQGPNLPNKVRVCRHLSKEDIKRDIPSVNSFIVKDDFPTRFDTAVKVAKMNTGRLSFGLASYGSTRLSVIALAPPGTEACTLDIEKFHRTCPALPDHKPWLVVQGRPGEFYIDHCLPFGAACASSNAGMIANALVDIWTKKGFRPVLKYEDDIQVFRSLSLSSPSSYAYDFGDVVGSVKHLGVPWHATKGTLAFTARPVFLGLLWDIPARSVALTEEKRQKFLFRASIFISRFSSFPCNLKEVERLHGSLCYIAFVFPEGRSRLPSLSNFAASFNGSEFATRFPPRSVISDVKWWISRLSILGHSRPLVPPGPRIDHDIYVDASTEWGIGLSIRGRWMAFRLVRDWKSLAPNRDICWLECLAVEFLVYVLEAEGVENCTVVVRSDNMGTIGAVLKGRSRNPHINLCMRRIFSVCASRFISLDVVHVSSENNIADPISRGRFVFSVPMSKDPSDDASHVDLPSGNNKPPFLASDTRKSESRPSYSSPYGRLARSSPYTRAATLARTGQSPSGSLSSSSSARTTALPSSISEGVAHKVLPSYVSPYVQNRARLLATSALSVQFPTVAPTLAATTSQPRMAPIPSPSSSPETALQPSFPKQLHPISSFQPVIMNNSFVLPAAPKAPSSLSQGEGSITQFPKGGSFKPSDLRPRVLAKDRLAAWSTPFGIKRREEAALGFLPRHAVDKAYSLALDSLEESSKATYGAGLLRFTQFCNGLGIAEDKRMPASSDLVAAFVANSAGKVSGATIKAWLSGLRAWHIFNKAPWSEDKFLSLIRTAAKKAGVEKKRPPRAPISLSHLEALLEGLDIVACREDAAIWACATATFFGCRRLGETTVSLAPFHTYRHVSRGADISHRTEKGSIVVESVCIHLPWTKTTKDLGGKIILTRRNDSLCPVFAFRNHLELNELREGDVASEISLFAYRDHDGSFRHMFKEEFLSKIQKIWKGLPDLALVSGHSFRIGGAVALLLAGVEPEVVAAAGGWTSMAFLLYWRRLESIVPQFTAKAYANADWATVKLKLDRMNADGGLSPSMVEASDGF